MASAAVRILICLFAFVASTTAGAAVTAEVSGARALNVRAGPGTEYPVRGSLVEGAGVTVLGAEGDWASVRLPDGTTGYVHRSFLRLATGASWEKLGSPASPTPSPTPTPIEEETGSRGALQPGGAASVSDVTGERAAVGAGSPGGPASAEVCADLEENVDRLLRLTEEMRADLAAEHAGAVPTVSTVDFGEPPGAGPILSIAAAGAVFGFLIGTLYGRRQERNRRTRVRL